MRRYCQSENYISLDTLDFIAEHHKDLFIRCAPDSYKNKTWRFYLYTCEDPKRNNLCYYLGCTRPIKVFPPRRYKHLCSRIKEIK